MSPENRNPKRGLAALALGLCLVASGCVEEQVAGSTSTGNTGKGAIAGRVVDAGGKGVAHAKVRVVAVDHNPGPGGSGSGDVADVVVTAADGSFETDSLPDGRYNLLSDKDGLVSFRDSVAVDPDSATRLAGDTLKAPGSVSGVVRLQPGHDSRTVFLILLGTTTFSVPKDSTGNFQLGRLAEGEYRLRVLSTLDSYKPMDTTIRVRSGIDAALPDTLRLAYQALPQEIPVVDDVSVAYDTVKMAATLSWKRRPSSRVSAYHVYRRHRDSGFVRVTAVPLADTAFTEDWSAGLVPRQVYHYAVAALDPQGNEGRKGEPAVVTIAVKYQVQVMGPPSDCGVGKCNYDIGPDGRFWVAEINGTVLTQGPGGYKWFDELSVGSAWRQIAVDGAGDVYLLYQNPLRLGKYTPKGDSLWLLRLPFERDVAFSLQRAGDTLLVWGYEERVMTSISMAGKILRQDTLKSYAPASGLAYPLYKPGIGYYSVVSGSAFESVRFHDGDGTVISEWKPKARGYLRDLARGPDGRWYLSWNNGVLDVYSADRILLGSVPVGGAGDLKMHGGRLYMMQFPMPHHLMRIDPGF